MQLLTARFVPWFLSLEKDHCNSWIWRVAVAKYNKITTLTLISLILSCWYFAIQVHVDREPTPTGGWGHRQWKGSSLALNLGKIVGKLPLTPREHHRYNPLRKQKSNSNISVSYEEWVSPLVFKSIYCLYYWFHSGDKIGLNWHSQHHTKKKAISKVQISDISKLQPRFSQKTDVFLKNPAAFWVELILPLCSNPFCKWFWRGCWVPKHLLIWYLDVFGALGLVGFERCRPHRIHGSFCLSQCVSQQSLFFSPGHRHLLLTWARFAPELVMLQGVDLQHGPKNGLELGFEPQKISETSKGYPSHTAKKPQKETCKNSQQHLLQGWACNWPQICN